MSKSDQSVTRLPSGTLLTYYGDDLTGSTAVMEALSLTGISTILFLNEYDEELINRLPQYRAVGIAGIARSKSPEWMDEVLPNVYKKLMETSSPLIHYKICSTLDSTPEIGSIGRAIDIGASIIGGDWHPLLVAAPIIGRYQAFGNLFAAAGSEIYRLDRHPVMTRHPITPMNEADVRLHLAHQTNRRIGLVDYISMKEGKAQTRLQSELTGGAEIISLDVVDDETLCEAGRLIWENRGERLFVVGSQGIEYALLAYWRLAGWLPDTANTELSPTNVERIACVSGSCSWITAKQIDYAVRHGFAPIEVDATQAIDEMRWESEIDHAIERARLALQSKMDPLIFTARQQADLARVSQAIEASTCPASVVQARIGIGLGKILSRLVGTMKLRRVVVAGGDTSSYVAKELGISAMSLRASLAPGAPLCHAYGLGGEDLGLEVAFKGGQMGQENYFLVAKG